MGFLVSKRDGANLMLALADGGAVEVFDSGPANGAPLHVVGPNTLTSFAESFIPGTSGTILAVADCTPQVTGIMVCSIELSITTSAVDQPAIALFDVNALTAITGGSPLPGTLVFPTGAPGGITLRPASTTPPFSGVPSDIDQRPTFTSGLNNAVTLYASCTVVSFTRTGIVAVATSPQNTTWNIIGNMSVHELL